MKFATLLTPWAELHLQRFHNGPNDLTKPYKEPTITLKGQRLQVVDKFTYLENTLSRAVHIDDEVNARIAKLVQRLAVYVEVFETEVESDLTQSRKYTDQWCR